MADGKTSFLETAYTKTATFLRDVFQYFFCGVLFMVLVILACESKNYRIIEKTKESLALLPKELVIVWALITAYAIGQLMLALSDLIFKIYKCFHKRMPDNLLKTLDDKKQPLREILRNMREKRRGPGELLDEGLPEHLYFEMVVFVKRRDLHSRFIERYNLLKNMHRILSASVLVSGLICTFLPEIGRCEGDYEWPSKFQVLAGVVMLCTSVVFYRQTIKTEIEFLNRVIASYYITTEAEST